MGPQTTSDDPYRPTRPRSNTATFTPPFWRRGRPETSVPPILNAPALSFDELLEALTPPAVPSLNHARAFAISLATHSPRPRLTVLTPILAVLCAPDSPPALQSAGYEILGAYWLNNGSVGLTTADRLSCLTLLLNLTSPWLPEVWESRYKALLAFTSSGSDTEGMETELLKVMRTWIEGAFDGLVDLPPEERSARQRSVETMTNFLLTILSRTEFVARLSDEDTTGILHMYGGLIDSALGAAEFLDQIDDSKSPHSGSSSRTPLRHQRNASSSSLSSTAKHPVDFAVELFLNYLSVRLKAIAPDHLKTIVPYLFRALAYYSNPLPRLSLSSATSHTQTIQSKITELLDTAVSGPYSASCILILKCHLFPSSADLVISMRTSLGAFRTLRLSIRRALLTRMARVYISRTMSDTYTPSGAPGRLDLENDLMSRAWAKDDVAVWSINRVVSTICRAVDSWIALPYDETTIEPTRLSPETILLEVTGILLDMSQGLDDIADSDEMDEEEVEAVGKILRQLVTYVHVHRNGSGSPIALDLARGEASSPFLAALSHLLSQNLKATPLHTVLPTVILSIAEHITDNDTARVVNALAERHSLTPTTPAWIDHWKAILSIPGLYTIHRPLTRNIVSETLQSVWGFIKDIPTYRTPLASLILQVWRREIADNNGDCISSVLWRILGDELVFRKDQGEGVSAVSDELVDGNTTEGILRLLVGIANAPPVPHELVEMPLVCSSPDVSSPTSPGPGAPSASPISPVLSRMQTDFHGLVSNAETSMPSVMSLLSSLTSGNRSRSQSRPRRPIEPLARLPSPSLSAPRTPVSSPTTRSMGAVSALICAFGQLAFTGLALNAAHRLLAKRIFLILVEVSTAAACSRARVTALQFLMRLRVDRDHRLYYASATYDENGHVHTLASQISRVESRHQTRALEESDSRMAPGRMPSERDGRRTSRDPGRPYSPSRSSRSRSRAGSSVHTKWNARTAPAEPLWSLPETLPFSIMTESETPSDGLISFDPAEPKERLVLPLSSYLAALLQIITEDKSWEVLSYVLCHLPSQLANKHLFCGPKSRVVIGDLLGTLSKYILENIPFGSGIMWPEGIVPRDAHGLAYATLTVLVSYRRCFPEAQAQHRLVEAFLVGLNAQPATIKYSLHGLSLSAFELQPSIKKFLSRILEKLSQIMSNPVMAVHIIDFLSIVGSLPALHTNFTEADHKMVFGVALQYLQHYNRADGSMSNVSWALSQHVRLMSYYIVYLWFLATPLPDRPRHVKFITRQLLLANEGQHEVDEPAEVCFDWLARYTYASADPRPANSMLTEIIMNPTHPQEVAISEKTWIFGNSVVTIRALERRGWAEILTRRASGLTKFICRAENVPLLTAGDVDPDILALPAALTLERNTADLKNNAVQDGLGESPNADIVDHLDPPDPITGYVWSGSAPSQRRKDVAIDPGYFAVQLSSYPNTQRIPPDRFLVDPARLPAFFRTLDRMPVIDTHKVGILYVAPGQKNETEILNNIHGSPAYTRFLEGLGRLINLRGQVDVYAGGLDPDEDGEYAYAWWDDIGQVLFHTATLMPSDDLEHATNKKRHIGNDFVRIIWNDSGAPYQFGTLTTQFQFVNIVIEPHSRGAIAAFSNNVHEHEYFKVTLQRAPAMTEFSPIGDFKLISAENLPLLVRQLSLLTDWYVSVFQHTEQDTVRVEMMTNWRSRLQAIKRFRSQVEAPKSYESIGGVVGQEGYRDFTNTY